MANYVLIYKEQRKKIGKSGPKQEGHRKWVIERHMRNTSNYSSTLSSSSPISLILSDSKSSSNTLSVVCSST